MPTDNTTAILTKEILRLAKEGLLPDQICEAFPDFALTPESVELIIRSASSNTEITLDEFHQSKRKAMLEILCEIAEDETKNESARVKAAAIVYEGKGMLPTIDADSFSERFRRMKELREKNDEKILQLPIATKAA